MLRHLLKPYPCNIDTRYIFVESIAVSIFIFLFLYVFQPFEISSKFNDHILSLSSMYSLITFICSFVMGFCVPKLFPKYFNDTNWHVLKEIGFICSIVLVISIVNFFASYQYYLAFDIDISQYTNSYLSLLLKAVSYTFSIAVIPCILLILFNQMRLLNKVVRESEQINRSLRAKYSSNIDQPISLSGEGKKEKVQLSMGEFLFARSSANYSEIYFMSGGVLNKKLLRSSMSNLEDQMNQYTNVSRVHRSFIANLAKVINVSGNAQGYHLHFENTSEFVPVSRQKSKEVKSRLVA